MRLLFLHGAPAAGKLTTAIAVQRLTGARVFDNHTTIDLARTLIPFDEPGFWELVDSVRRTALTEAARHGVDLIVTTACYSHPEDLPAFEAMEALVRQSGGEVLPVYLDCPRDELVARVGSPGRAERSKITTVEILDDVLSRWNIAPVPRDTVLRLDTSTSDPEGSARRIVSHFDLDSTGRLPPLGAMIGDEGADA